MWIVEYALDVVGYVKLSTLSEFMWINFIMYLLLHT